MSDAAKPTAERAASQAALINAITAGVGTTLAPQFSEVQKSLASTMVTINALEARLTILESLLKEGVPAAKRATRNGTAAKPAAAKAGAKKEGGTFSNSLLYFRHILEQNVDGAWAKWGAPREKSPAVVANKLVKKLAAGVDSPEGLANYRSAVGFAIWGDLGPAERDTIRGLLAAAKSARVAATPDPQLDEDDAGADGADDADE